MKNAMSTTTLSPSKHLPGHEIFPTLIRALISFCLRVRQCLTNSTEPLTNFVPARSLNAVPRFNFAVYSLRDESDEAVLENSYRLRADAESLLSTYQSTRLENTTFFLVSWSEQRTLRIFRYDAKARQT